MKKQKVSSIHKVFVCVHCEDPITNSAIDYNLYCRGCGIAQCSIHAGYGTYDQCLNVKFPERKTHLNRDREYRIVCKCYYRELAITGDFGFTGIYSPIYSGPTTVRCLHCGAMVCQNAFNQGALRTTSYMFTPKTAYKYTDRINKIAMLIYLLRHRGTFPFQKDILHIILRYASIY